MAKVLKKGFIEKLLNKLGFVKSVDMASLLGGMYTATGQGISHQVTYSTMCNSYRSWVYTCISKISQAIAMLPIELLTYEKQGRKLKGLTIKNHLRALPSENERKEFLKQNQIEEIRIDDHPFLDLINNPNTLDTRFTLWLNIVIRLELAGYCGVYSPVYKGGLMSGLPAELWVLPLTNTATLKPIPDEKTIIKGYKYTDGTQTNTFAPDELMYIKYPHPNSPFDGMSPLMAQLYPYDIDLFLMQQQYAALRNTSRPGNVFTTDAKLLQSHIAELKAQVESEYRGALNTGKPMVLHGGLKLDDRGISNAIADMMIKDVSEFARDKLISSYDVTPGKLGLVKDVNRASLIVLDKTFYKECIQPKTMLIEEYFEKNILPKYSDKLTLGFQLPEITDRELDIKEKEIDAKYGIKSINEIREKENLEPAPWGEVPFMPFNMSRVDSSPDIPPEIGDKKIKSRKMLTPLYWTQEKRLKANEEFVKITELNAKLLIPVIKAHFRRQENIVLGKLETAGKSLSGHMGGFGKQKRRSFLTEHKDMLAGINIDPIEEAANLQEVSAPVIELMVKNAGDWRLESLGFTTEIDMSNPVVEKWLSNRLRFFSKEVEGTTFSEIQAILREGFREGLPLTTIGQNLKEKFAQWEKWRAQTISRTEAISASNFGDLESVKQEKVPLRKFWLNEVDARETHQIAGGQYTAENAIELDKEFFVGADSMTAPGNGSLPEENCNCRCGLGYVEK